MSGFDIQSLYGFHPGRYRCRKCLALFPDAYLAFVDSKEKRTVCPICGVQYLPTKDFFDWQIEEYLDRHGFSIKFQDLLHHCQQLAGAAQILTGHTQENPFWLPPPITALFAAFSRAQHFIHFTTYGISYVIIGALKVVAQRVAVRGVVSNVYGETLAELTEFSNEAPPGQFEMKVYGSAEREIPQQKLVVVDGLLAFKGSANLYSPSWRKAAEGRETVEAVTDVDEVIRLHNRYFSSIWAEFSRDERTIEMREFG